MHKDIPYIFVDNEQNVQHVCALIDSLESHEFIGLDTEFMRVTCFYPDFSLLQLAIRGQNYLVDVWMLDGRVGPLIKSLCFTKAVVLAFACSEDIELLSHEARRINCGRVLPERIYDLQLMLAFCGHSYGRGLNFALNEFLGVSLAKDCTRSNWNRRPLSNEQLIYGALDVHYLEALYLAILKIISKRNFAYFLSEMQYIKSRFDEDIDDNEAYLNVSAAGMLSDKELNILQYLAKKRLQVARYDNQALNRVITSKAMWQLARYTPRSKKELELRGVKPGTIREYGDDILLWIKEAKKAPRYERLTIPYDYFSHQRVMQENFECLKKLIKQGVHKSGICEQVLMKKQLLNDYFRAKALGCTPLLQSSWRLELLGKIDVPLEPMIKDEEVGENYINPPAFLS